MADYFSEFTGFVGTKGLPSPVDTPYETPGFIRSKRSSRATAASSREHSASPPPLPPDAVEYADKPRDGRYSALDPRRFTPTLHASLVSEILNLRRELDSKNHLVENLETSLSSARNENETLVQQVSEHQKEVRKAKTHVQQMERGTYDAVEELIRERDGARQQLDDMRNKVESATKKARRQDEDAVRTMNSHETEKEQGDAERRQLERRIHVTENRLRTVVDEMATQQVPVDMQNVPEETGDESMFKDSGLGNESDTTSVRSATPVKHKRNVSSISTFSRTRSLRNSASTRASMSTPEPNGKPNGYSLADELGIDEEDEYDMDDFEHADDELEYPEPKRRTVEFDTGLAAVKADSKAKRILGITTDLPDSPIMGSYRSPTTPAMKDSPKKSNENSSQSEPSSLSNVETLPLQGPALPPTAPQKPGATYVDNGYQPSPPPSPQHKGTITEQPTVPIIHEPVVTADAEVQTEVQAIITKHALEVATRVAASPISPPETPIIDGVTWPEDERMSISAPAYSTASTQTDLPEPERPKSMASKRDSLSPPSFVPSIAIHPPSSRPSSPRRYVLPPGTKNASTQASRPWPGKDAEVQTEEIRVDKRLRVLPSQNQPQRVSLLPSPTLPEPPAKSARRAPSGGTAKIFTKQLPQEPTLPSPPLQSPIESSPEVPRNNSSKDLRNLPLRAIPLPRPVLAPARNEGANDGPLNRSSMYGVTRPLQSSAQLADIDKDSDESDYDDAISDVESRELAGSIPAFSKAPHGRFGLSSPPKRVPEDKEISPDRRPDTADSYGACPAPSVSSSRAPSQRAQTRPPAKLNAYKDPRSRSPSFGSMASSSYSTQSALPPYPIPRRSSSRVNPHAKPVSEGSQSPTPNHGGDMFGRGGLRGSRAQHTRQNSLRKVQSAAVMRAGTRAKTSPQKGRRRRRSPDLSPVHSMAFAGPAQTKFPIPSIPSLPTPLQEQNGFDLIKGSVDLGKAPSTAATSMRRPSEETHLVDAIAATMVGEWMWKYMRKRKSFGIPDEPQNDFPHRSVNGAVSITNHGTRHKRWVWLSPYERTVMWDNKQPTSGTALLGKKGRKLTIQSVLDVQDNTPMPKGAELQSAFNRSILILTPQRALKFTATTSDRHHLWMTALSFLAQSGGLPAQFPAVPQLPPVPPKEPPPTKRARSPSFGRATIRDSVRLAKGRRPSLHQTQSEGGALDVMGENGEHIIQGDTGADFPAVPRLYISTTRHQRKRSNTSPRLPPPLHNLRSISSSAIPSSGSSRLHPASTTASSFRTDWRSSSSKSGNSIASPDQPNFFEAVGTVRMEAFVDPNVRDGVLYVPAPPPAAPLRSPRRRRGDSNLSTSTIDKRRAGYVFDENGMDPFKGF